jgi:prepilin-type N-terminal cleavage/methylation domain-containing protein
MKRRGFTLLELMIALVVGSTVVLLAYATLRGGVDTQDRVTRVKDEQETMTVLRAMLSDGMRHAAVTDGDAVRLASDVDGQARSLHFTSRGIDLPHGASAAWRVVLYSDSTAVLLDAEPISRTNTNQPLRLRAPAARAFAVRFLAPTETEWRDRWEDSTRLPSAVEIQFLDGHRRRIGAPLLVRTAAMERL